MRKRTRYRTRFYVMIFFKFSAGKCCLEQLSRLCMLVSNCVYRHPNESGRLSLCLPVPPSFSVSHSLYACAVSERMRLSACSRLYLSLKPDKMTTIIYSKSKRDTLREFFLSHLDLNFFYNQRFT